VAAPVTSTLSRPPGAPYDVAFLDPPYPLDDVTVSGDLDLLWAQHWLVPGAMVVVERSSRSPEPMWPQGTEGRRKKRYGETTLWYGHAAANPEDPQET
jgi:16S rRNA (guanine966-N2)-methyltransferase